MGSLSRWVIFLAAFFCIYGAFHLYVLIKVRRALYLESWGYILWVVILLFLMTALINARILTESYPIFSLALTWIGYLWMAYLFLFVCLAIPIDSYHLMVSLLQQLFNVDWTNVVMLRRNSLALVAIGAGGVMIYGAYAAYQVGVEHISLRSPKISATDGRVRIVQISDLHLGQMLYPGRLNPILATIRTAQPDILVSTGDLVDGKIMNETEVARELNALPAKIGKFSVSGNHEKYHGIENAMAFTSDAGFKPLHDESVPLGHSIIVVGLDDASERQKERELLAGLPPEKFILLLKHRPDVTDGSPNHFDLQLSGHTHKGQIFPFGLIVKLFYPMYDGLYRLTNGGHLYVSRGTGTWGPPIRVFAPPEVTIIDLLPQKAPSPTGPIVTPQTGSK